MKSNEFGSGWVCGAVAIGVLAIGFVHTLVLGYKIGATNNTKELKFYKEAYEKNLANFEKHDTE